MRNYKARRTIGNNEKHMVYYLHTRKNIPLALGWDFLEIAQITNEDRILQTKMKCINTTIANSTLYHCVLIILKVMIKAYLVHIYRYNCVVIF